MNGTNGTVTDLTNLTAAKGFLLTTGSQPISLNSYLWNNLCSNLSDYYSNATSNSTTITCNSSTYSEGFFYANGVCVDYPWNLTFTTQNSSGYWMDIAIYGNSKSLQFNFNDPVTAAQMCGWRIQDAGPEPDVIWLGEAFLNQFITVWDVE
jgi:hypothetical protein